VILGAQVGEAQMRFVGLCECCGRGHCAMCGAVVAVFAPRVVPWSPSLRHMWCRSRHLCAACGVAGAVVAPHVVLWSQSLRHVGVAGAIIALRVVPQSRLCAAWCRGCSHFAVCNVAVVVAGPGGRGGPHVRQ